jgi:hypothetical protein
MAGAVDRWPVISSGHRGQPVRTLQHLLRAHGQGVRVDGDFGPRTAAAVRAVQRNRGLTADGVVGPKTWPTLVIEVKHGSDGDAVRGVQGELRFREPGALRVDGVFGPRTEAAVRRFQAALAAQVTSVAVDGIVGPVTWQALVGGMLPPDAPQITVEDLQVTVEPGSSGAAPQLQLGVAGGDLALVAEPARVELPPDSTEDHVALRCRVTAVVRVMAGFRIAEIRGSVTCGIVLGRSGAGSAEVRTRTTLGGVALPPTSSTEEGPLVVAEIPPTPFPALNQCCGDPLVLEILIGVDARRTTRPSHIIADFDGYDLHVELTRCP